MRVAIVGAGLIGQKRAAALGRSDELAWVVDPVLERAAMLAKGKGAEAALDWRLAVADPLVDAVIVATPHSELATIALGAVEAGKHVLLEKPGARRPGELDLLAQAVEKAGVSVHVGFNHRFHPALRRAHELVRSGALGPLYYIRGRYGHGGRVGYDREWRADPRVSGGGELLDQGAHLIDLASWYFAAPFHTVHGTLATFFWDMPVEDNAFLTLSTSAGQIAQLHVTWTEWKNLFSLEITGRDAKLHIEGLGGSYGTERLAYYAMRPEMGPPDTTIWEYPGPDGSWRAEWEAFRSEIQGGVRECEAGLASTQAVLEVVETIYRQNQVSWLEEPLQE